MSGLNINGICQPADSLKILKIYPWSQIDFSADTGRRVQSVYYFQTDISDEGLKKNTDFQKYLSLLPDC